MPLTLTIGGVNYLPFVDFRSISVQDRSESRGDTMSFVIHIYDRAIDPPTEGKEVIFKDDSTTEFAGVMVRVRRAQGEGGKQVIYTCTCMDYVYYLDRRMVNGTYPSQPVDLMMKSILADLRQAALDESASGDAHYNAFYADLSKIALGPAIGQQTFDKIYPSQAFDQISEAAGMSWWIDFDKRVNLSEVESLLASHLPVPPGRSRPALLVDTDTLSFYDMEIETDIVNVGTRSILKDTVVRSTDVQTDTVTWTTGSSSKIFLSRRPFSYLDVISVKKNGVSQPLVLEDIGVSADAEPASGQVAVYVGPRGGAASYVRFRTSDLSSGDVIEVKYNYDIAVDYHTTSLVGQADMKVKTGGDGIHEFVFTQISGLDVVSMVDLEEISEIILNRKSLPLITGRFTSMLKGWAARQAFDFIWNYETLDIECFVTSVTKRVRAPNLTTLETIVEFSNIPRGIRI